MFPLTMSDADETKGKHLKVSYKFISKLFQIPEIQPGEYKFESSHVPYYTSGSKRGKREWNDELSRKIPLGTCKCCEMTDYS